MKRRTRKTTSLQRVGAFVLALVMVLGIVPAKPVLAADTSRKLVGTYETVADPDTVSRPVDLYGTNTMNAGKVTVGKSVSDTTVNLTYGSSDKDFTPAAGNFIVTSSQTAQVLGLASESPVPVDVVFVLDTSNSMDNNVNAMVSAANSAIETLLTANENNRVGVVAFSGTQGGGTSNGAAANTLSPLAYYSTNQSNHLYIRNGYLYGRGTTTDRWGQQITMNRDATSSGTNIHAGVVAGARLLMEATDTTINIGGTSVTRLPFLVVMSDGQPSYASDDSNWYDPNLTQQSNNLSNNAGVGFLPALTAAYYKGKITEKYFNSAASDKNRCFVYTLGLGLEDLDSDQRNLALMTVDPAGQTSSNTYYDDFEDYWAEYQDGQSFNVNVGGQNVSISSNSITATTNAVNAKNSSGSSMGYTGGYVYNDEYFSASQGSQLESVFGDVITTIQKQALSSPTHVEQEHGADFSGYVTYTDPLGEYMEVKDVHGILVNGKLFEGKSFAQHMQSWNSAPTAFKSKFAEVLQERCKVTGSTMDVNDFISKAVASENQAYYRGENNYDNSLAWWGRSYNVAGEIDDQVQWLDFADNDTVEYITNPATTKPNGATHICRSYYFYGTAGDVDTTPAEDLLHFVVRIQRELEAPYRQTVVVSIPASLLSVDEVFVTEKKDNAGNPTYEAEVEKAEPARVVYEVGLRSDINAYNVAQIVGEDTDYIGETTQDVANGAVRSTNYSVGTDGKENFTFYTNDWNRAETEEEHHRAMTHVTFDAATDNSFYTYTADTLIYIRNGDNYTVYNGSGTPAGTDYYYARDVYDWAGKSQTNGVYTGVTKRTEYIPIDIPANASVFRNTDNGDNITNGWYVRKGVFKASSLTGSEDIYKRDENGQRVNPTGTAVIVSHPHRTDTESNSHYTVLLGNNGKLTLTAEKTKHVSIEKPATTDLDGNPVAAQTLTHADGKPVMVGDILTYTIDVINPEKTAATATVTDTIPTGTVFVSAEDGGQLSNDGKQIVWTGVTVPAATAQGYGVEHLTFKVKVTEEALKLVTVDNTAYVDFGNDYAYETNTVKNPPEGKTVTNTSSTAEQAIVPNVLRFDIYWVNDSGKTSTVTITDKLPTGTTFISASDNGKYENGVITWELKDVLAGKDGVVSFRANVNPNVEKEPNSSDGIITNKAEIQIGDNDPRVVITNDTITKVKLDDLVITKEIVRPDGDTTVLSDATLAQEFTLEIFEVMARLEGEKTMLRNGTAETIYFKGGVAYKDSAYTQLVTIKHGDTLVIKDIPVGSIFSVTEAKKAGFTPAYYENGATTAETDEGRVTIKENTTTDVKNSAKVDIKNEYKVAPVKFQMQVTKDLDTTFELGETKFGFVAAPCDANGENADLTKAITGEVLVSSDDDTETFTFPETAFNAEDTHYLLVYETNGGVTGVNYTADRYLLKIVVSDNGTGQLQVDTKIQKSVNGAAFSTDDSAFSSYAVDSISGNSNITFINTYAPKEVDFTIPGTKEFSGRALQANEFSFEVKDGNNNLVATGNNDANGNIIFTPINYKTTGEHEYLITEVPGGAYGVIYSPDVYRITVKVTQNQETHALDANITKWEKGDGTNFTELSDNDRAIKFTNSFKPDDEQLKLTGLKHKVDENNADVALADQEFAFTVEQQTDSGWIRVAGGNNTDTDDAGDRNDNIVFSAITYKASDFENVQAVGDVKSIHYVYRVKELPPTGPAYDVNMDYDDAVFYVFVTATYNTRSGELDYQITKTTTDEAGNVPATNGIVFTNVKYPDTITVKPEGFKHTNTGSSAATLPEDTAFSFVVLEGENVVGSGVSTANPQNGEPNIAFTGLTYGNEDVGKTFTYTIKEAHSGIVHGITHDPAKFTMSVAITRVNGQLQASVFYAGVDNATLEDGKPTFTNTYAADGYLNITAHKTLNSDTNFNGKTFSFVMYECDENGTVLEGAVPVEGISDASGNIRFATLYYSLNDFPSTTVDTNAQVLHKYYKITEVEPASGKYPGVTYNAQNSSYLVKVELTHTPGSGAIGARVLTVNGNDATGNNGQDGHSANLTGAVFNNTYAPVEGTSVRMEAVKVLPERDLREGEFEFELYYVNAEGEHLVDTAANTATGSDNKYDDIYFVRTYAANTPTGTYKYIIRENANGNLGGMTYDTTAYYALVTISDAGAGSLSSSVKYYSDAACTQPIAPADVKFTNHYAAKGADFSPKATKSLEHRAIKNGEFGFEVKDAQGNVVSTGHSTLTGAGTEGVYQVKFSPIGYKPADLAGITAVNGVKTRTFAYTVSELPGSDENVHYDTAEYILEVTVTDDGSGYMSATGAYFESINGNKGAALGTDVIPAFENTYRPQAISVNLQATKKLEGRDMTEGEFSFVAKEVTGVTGNVPTLGAIKATGGNAAAADGVDAAVTFTNIGFNVDNLAGINAVNGKKIRVFTYQISEQTPTQGGVSGQGEVYYAKVTLIQEMTTGELSATVKYYANANGTGNEVVPVFKNTYTTNPVTLRLPVDKTLVGKKMAADEFTFTVKEASLDAEGNLNIGATAKDENSNEMIAKNKASGEVEFGKLKFTAPGTYIYQVEESVTRPAGMNDEDYAKLIQLYKMDIPVVVVVTVEDDLLGNLVVDAQYHMNYKGDGKDVNLGSVEFVNYYTAPPIEEDLTVQIDATKTLQGRKLREGEFKFNVYDIYNNIVSTGTNKDLDSDGIFGEIKFTPFTFKSADEYHYWIVESTENLAPGVTADSRVWEVFINVRYNELTGKLYVDEVTTFLVGRAVADEANKPAFVNVYQPAPKTQTFTAKKELVGRELRDREFLFRMADANGLIAAEAYNDAKGNINFQIEYTQAGNYSYTITEVAGSDPYIAYNVDKASYKVDVEVKDTDGDGQFEIAVRYADSNRVFENKYTPESIKVPIYANKTMTGDKEFAGEQFSFQLKEKKPVEGGLTLTQKNDTNGLVTFNVTLGAGGQYVYTLSEIKGTDSHITYDTKSYDVVVDVVDDGHGKLTATVTYPGEENAAPVFVNQYKADPYLLALEGTKELTGRKMTEGEFNFVVHDSEGTQVATAKNDADGKLVFSNKVKLPVVGNYTLTVSEVKGTDTTVTYDETKFTVTATVTNNNGVLEAEVKYPEGGIAFVNKYEEPEKPTETTEPTETTKPAETTKPTEPKAPGAPDTGDHANVLLYGVMAVVSLGAAMAAVIALMSKKRRRS